MKWIAPIMASFVILVALVQCNRPKPLMISPVATPVAAQAKPTKTPTPFAIPPIVYPGNLLTDSSMEETYHSNDGYMTANTSGPWRAWWIATPPCIPYSPADGSGGKPHGDPKCDIPCPENCGRCDIDYGCYWAMPEFNPFDWGKGDYRIHSGWLAQQQFTYGRMGEGGIYQSVVVTPGDMLLFSVWFDAWQCYEFGDPCEWGRKSDKPGEMNLEVGIDPTGGIVPTATTVVWSSPVNVFDKWEHVLVATSAISNTVTVFTRAAPRWDFARMNNDVYIDDARLIALNHRIFFPIVERER